MNNNNPNEYNGNYGNEYQGYSPSASRSKTVIAVIATAVVLVMLIVTVMVIAMKVTNINTSEKATDIKGSAKVISLEDDNEAGKAEGVLEEEVENPSERVIMYIANVENSVYFRSEPLENESNIITTIPFGTAVFFLSNENTVFAKIEYDGKTGFVKRDYLSMSVPQKPVKAEDNTVKSYKYVANVENSVYLRKGPSGDSGYYTTIPLGERVGFIEKANSIYSKVSYNGQIGYITSKYLSDNPYIENNGYMIVCNVKNSIYLRSEPSINENNIICTIPVGSVVEYLDSGYGEFYRISWNGNVGFAKSEYLSWYTGSQGYAGNY